MESHLENQKLAQKEMDKRKSASVKVKDTEFSIVFLDLFQQNKANQKST